MDFFFFFLYIRHWERAPPAAFHSGQAEFLPRLHKELVDRSQGKTRDGAHMGGACERAGPAKSPRSIRNPVDESRQEMISQKGERTTSHLCRWVRNSSRLPSQSGHCRRTTMSILSNDALDGTTRRTGGVRFTRLNVARSSAGALLKLRGARGPLEWDLWAERAAAMIRPPDRQRVHQQYRCKTGRREEVGINEA